MSTARMRVLEWAPATKPGMFLGRVKISLPNGLEIAEIGIFGRDGRRWCQFPGEVMRDRDDRPMLDQRGKKRYRNLIKWASSDVQNAWSDALVRLVEDEHGPIGGGQ